MAAWSWNGSGEAAPSLVTPCSQVSLVNLRKLCTHVLPKYFWSTINFTSHILYRRRESSQPLAPCTKVPKLTPLDLYIPNWMHIHLFFLPLDSFLLYLSTYLSVYLPAYLPTYLPTYLPYDTFFEDRRRSRWSRLAGSSSALDPSCQIISGTEDQD